MEAMRTRTNTRTREEGRTGGRERFKKGLPRSVAVSRTSSMKAIRTRKRKRMRRPRMAISTLGPDGGGEVEGEEMNISKKRRNEQARRRKGGREEGREGMRTHQSSGEQWLGSSSFPSSSSRRQGCRA